MERKSRLGEWKHEQYEPINNDYIISLICDTKVFIFLLVLAIATLFCANFAITEYQNITHRLDRLETQVQYLTKNKHNADNYRWQKEEP